MQQNKGVNPASASCTDSACPLEFSTNINLHTSSEHNVTSLLHVWEEG